MKTLRLSILLVFGAQLFLACGAQPTQSEGSTCVFENNSMPNPASDYCVNSGYSDIDGICHFADGTECEQWAFFRGECGLDRTFCAQQGYTPKAESGEVRCVFDDGTSCNDWDYSRGCCAANE